MRLSIRDLRLLLQGCAIAVSCAAVAAPDGADAFIGEGEQALRLNDAARAQAAFERAASLRHDAAAEWGLVRSWMQQGEYRRALAFAAHAAEGHGELVEGAGLYAWLLHIGGQTALAQRILEAALQRQPNNAVLQATQRRLRAPADVPDMRLLQGPARQAPAVAPVLPPASRAVASGLLMPAGVQALVPALSVQNVSAIWVRDAMGRTVPAKLQRVVPELGMAELVLDAPLGRADQPLPVAERDAFPGSPEMALEFAADGDVTPTWPVLHTGFVGRWQSEGWYALGAELASHGHHGGPVYDTSGRLVGVALRGADAQARLLSASALRSQWPQMFAAPARGAGREILSPDAVYERAMAVAVQVIVVPLRSD